MQIHSHTEAFSTMKKPMIALLLSALVMPGAGHLYLKHFVRGVVLLMASLACLWVIMDWVLELTGRVFDGLAEAGGAPDPGQLADLVMRASDNSGIGSASLILATCWVVGMLDAYRLGCQADRA